MRKFRESASRTQLALLPGSIDDYVPKADIVRYVDSVVEQLDLTDIESKFSTFGRPAFNPRMLVKVLVYGKLRGIRSGRELSQATKENFRFIFLANNEKPDFRTINVFRKTFSKELAAILIKTVKIGLREQIITLNHVSIDGTKLGAFAGRNSFKDPRRLQEDLKELEKILAESIANDVLLDDEEDKKFGDDDDGESPLPKKLQDKKALADKIKRALDHYDSLEGEKPKSVSLSDPECRYMQSKGINPSYNAQAAVDADSRMVVGAEIVNACSDGGELAPMLSEIEQTTGANPKIVSADRGYSKKEDLEELEKRNIDGFVAQRKPLGRGFTMKDFQYDESTDSYICPSNRILVLRGTNNVRGNRQYGCSDCSDCHVRELCLRKPHQSANRTLLVSVHEKSFERMKTKTESDLGKQMAKVRSSTIEPFFGYIKYSKKFRQFQHRGLALVNDIWKFETAAYNIERLAKLFRDRAFPQTA